MSATMTANTMKRFAVLFNRELLESSSFHPPAGVSGDMMGSTDRGVLGVYVVRDEDLIGFMEAIQSCAAVIEYNHLDRLRSTN